MKYLLPCILMLLVTAPVRADWYQVEVIVFDYLYPDLGDELWFENPGLPLRDDTIELITKRPDEPETPEAAATGLDGEATAADVEVAPEPVPYLALPSEQQRLQGVWRIMRLSRDYRPLLHVTWQQEGKQRERGRAVHLAKMAEREEEDESLPPELAEIQIEEHRYQPPDPVFDGKIRLRASRFLHVDVDFAYFPRSFQQLLLSQQQALQESRKIGVNRQADYVRLTETRRIKLDELHYFDHPLFGIILQVTRLQNQS